MFVIPCKYTSKSPVVECVKSIRKYYKDELIVVVDSDSNDKSYFDKIKEYDSEVLDVGNKNYVNGALWHCYRKYKDEKFFYVIQDSMKIKMNFDYVEDLDFTCIASFPNTCWAENFEGGSEEHKRLAKELISKTNYKYLESNIDWHPVFGNSVFISRKLLDSLEKNGYDKCLGENKQGEEATERIWGMVLYQEGIDVKKSCIMSTPIHTAPNPIISKKWIYRT